jgi:hypothetical protein
LTSLTCVGLAWLGCRQGDVPSSRALSVAPTPAATPLDARPTELTASPWVTDGGIADIPNGDQSVAPSSPVASPSPILRVGEVRLQLVAATDACFIDYWPADLDASAQRRLTLALHPPCNLLLWNDEPPRAVPNATSDGVPVGHKGDARAWQYPSMQRTTVLIVIGDPVSESEWAKRPKLRGLHCGARAQAVLLKGAGASLSKNIETGFSCVEGGKDEKDFWLFAHDNR